MSRKLMIAVGAYTKYCKYSKVPVVLHPLSLHWIRVRRGRV